MNASPIFILLCLLSLLFNFLSAAWDARQPRQVIVSEDELVS